MEDRDVVNFGINWVKAVEYLDDDDIAEIKELGFDIGRLTDLQHMYKRIM
tara:strand:+ start:182 stop:331 length:150 start_codon:yes stop_codon:yes gene_type:complete